MSKSILAWYAYSETGEARRQTRQSIPSTTPASNRVNLEDPATVVGLFADVRQLDAEVGPGEWKQLFRHYGLEGLIDLAKCQGGWPEDTSDDSVAEAIVEEARTAGFDPAAGRSVSSRQLVETASSN